MKNFKMNIFLSVILLLFMVNINILKCVENNTDYDNVFEMAKTGYKVYIELGYQIAFTTNDDTDFWGYTEAEKAERETKFNRLKINVINGYQINQFIYLGIGTGLRFYNSKSQDGYNFNQNITSSNNVILNEENDSRFFFPLFGEFRIYYNNKILTPFITLSAGYSFSGTQLKGIGYILNPSIGLSYRYSSNSELNVSIGYDQHQRRKNIDSDYERLMVMRGIELTFGISF